MAILTTKQERLLLFLKKYLTEHNIAPTLDEIANFFGISKPAAQLRLRTLLLKGYITKEHNKPRSIKIKQNPESASVSLPVLGTISAGDGISVFEEPNPNLVEVPITMVRTDAPYYCLQVTGNSMIGDGIMDNDYIVVRQQNYVDNGDIAVNIIYDNPGEKANLKRFFNRGNKIELRPSNPSLSSKFYNPEQIEIRGKFVGLLRHGR